METQIEGRSRLQAPELPGYTVLQLLGAGGSGTVWAVRRDDGLRFAAKVVDGGVDDLDHEASLLRAIEHEHVVRLVDVRSTDAGGIRRAVLITELAEGGSLAAALAARDRLTPGELVTVLCPIARALHDLHGLGVVHADLSPGNILMTADGKPLIADLGVSRLAGVEGDEAWVTEAWAAPEVLAGRPATAAADTYSLGAIAWAALAGDPPGPAALRADLTDLAPELSTGLCDLVTSCLAHDPKARPSVGDVALALWECAPAEPAPVAGSFARRAASLDPGAELTRRIRAEARRDDDASDTSEQPWWRLRIVRRVAVAGAVIGVVCGGAVAVGPSAVAWATGASDSHHTSSAPHKTAVPARQPGHGGDSSSAGPAGGGSIPARPVRLIQRLVHARALAWRATDATDLGRSMVKDSDAYDADRRLLREARRRHLHYRGLDFTVRSAHRRAAEESATMTVRATIDRSAYVVAGDGTTRQVAAAPGSVVDLRLRQTSHGWRIADWSPVSSATASSGAG